MNLRRRFNSNLSGELIAAAREIGALADARGRRAVLVGGVVRDLLLNAAAADADFMLEHPARPIVEELARRLSAKLVWHERFLTFGLTFPSKKKIDVVTAREETYAAPARLPDVTPSTIELDLKRRDFTINAIACSCNEKDFGKTLDPFSGEDDIRGKRIRVLHEKSFEDDPTRIFRAARFAGRLGFELERRTESFVREAIGRETPSLLSPVRRRREFEMMLKERNPVPALLILQNWGALRFFHADWAGIDVESLWFEADAPPADRLALWFGRWGKARAQRMMTDLSFEKEVKRDVLSKLVQSPSKS